MSIVRLHPQNSQIQVKFMKWLNEILSYRIITINFIISCRAKKSKNGITPQISSIIVGILTESNRVVIYSVLSLSRISNYSNLFLKDFQNDLS